jgi:cell division protein FtsA
MLFRSKKDEKQLFLVLDIGTEIVKALVCGIEEGVVEILGAGKVRHSYTAIKGGVISNLRGVLGTCAETIKFATEFTEYPQKCIVGIAGELVKGIMIELSYNRPNSTIPIEKREIEESIEYGLLDAKKVCGKVYAPYNQPSLDIALVNAAILSSQVDNLPVEDPRGMSGKEVRLRVYYTFAPRSHIEYINSLAKGIGIELAGIVSEPLATIRSIRLKDSNFFNGILIDVGGGVTDIAIVKEGIIYGTEMIAFGGRVFTKRIAQDLMLNYEEAEELKIKYSQKALNRAKMAEVKNGIKKDINVWIDALEVAIGRYQKVVESFPPSVYLCGGGSLLPEIKEALMEYPWIKRFNFDRSPKVQFISPDMVDKVVDRTLMHTTPADITPLALARTILDLQN